MELWKTLVFICPWDNLFLAFHQFCMISVRGSALQRNASGDCFGWVYRSGGLGWLFSFLVVAFAFGCEVLIFGGGMDRSAGRSKLSWGYICPKDGKCYILLMQDNLTFKNWYRNRLLKTNAGKREATETSAEVRLDSYTRNLIQVRF